MRKLKDGELGAVLEKKEKATTDQVYDAFRAIIKNQDSPALNYAVNYAKAGLKIYNDHTLKVQVLYVLNNITHWRGDEAKAVRATLKSFSK